MTGWVLDAQFVSELADRLIDQLINSFLNRLNIVLTWLLVGVFFCFGRSVGELFAWLAGTSVERVVDFIG